MVTPLFTPGVLKIDYELSLGGRSWHIIRWLDNGLHPLWPYTATELAAAAAQCQAAFGGVQAFTTTDTTFVGTTVFDWGAATGLQGTVAAGGGGTEAPPALPIQCAAEIEWHINRRYRGGHPKTFLSGIAEARQTSNRMWTGAFVTALEAAATAWDAALDAVFITRGAATDVFTHVNFSRFTAHAERPAAQIDTIQSASVNGIISSQRRRRGRI